MSFAGGAGSAVAMGLCAVAVSEDTGGSTRVPALFNGLFGFDPARNHYPNGGNPGMSYTRDQIGVLARTMEDILLYDRAIAPRSADDDAAASRAASRPLRVGLPRQPFVLGTISCLRVDVHMRAKYDLAAAALSACGAFTTVAEEWPEDESPFGIVPSVAAFYSFSGQVAQWVYEYLDAPVSLREIIEDIGAAGASHDPATLHNPASLGSETDFRRMLGPLIKEQVERYNRYFDAHGVDLILIPAANSPPPTLAQTADATVPLETLEGQVRREYDRHEDRLL